MPAPKAHKPYPGCETGGRPKKYTEQFLDIEADALNEWIKDKQNIFIEDFCLERNYHDSRIPEFVRDNEKFSDAYNKLKMKQRVSLFKGGLTKKFAYPMCALLLGHNHGIVAKHEEEKEQVQNITYHVNYGNSEQVLPKALPTSDSTRSK